MFVDAFMAICEEKGIAPAKALEDVGMGRSAVSAWKNGVEPSNSTKRKLADYFHISIEELKTGKIKKPTNNRELSQLDKRLYEVFTQLTDDRKEFLLAQAEALRKL